MIIAESSERRFWSKVSLPATSSACMLWLPRPDRHGYGYVRINGKQYYAHRVAYELLVGPIPAGLHIDHLCRTRLCVHPDHLEAVTLAENNARKAAAVTHCPAGHLYDEANTYITAIGGRRCRTCQRAATSRSYFKRRALGGAR